MITDKMPKQLRNSSLTTRLFLEGMEVDLLDEIDISVTYSVADVKDISSKPSNYTKSLTVPGTKNNNNLFSFLFDIKSTGAEQNDNLPFFTATVQNLLSGCTITNATLDGALFSTPVGYGQEAQSFHNQVNNISWYIDVSGNTNGYVICFYNGVVVSSNKMSSSLGRYYFPAGLYAFNDVLQMTVQANPQPYSGNIGYDLDYKKRMRAYVIQDNQAVLTGYAKIISSTIKDGLISYTLQITSDLGGLIAVLANQRLEDLYTNVAPNLVLDPTGQTSKISDLATPYDHIFTTDIIVESWAGLTPFLYPLIDYGNDDTVGGTNFYTSNFRPCIHAKDYIDLIFARAGYTYDSSFLNSQYFSELIIPYKDGNISLIDTFPVTVSNNFTSGTSVVPAVVTPQANSFYIFNTVLSDQFLVYNAANETYTCTLPGTYIVNVSIEANYTLVPGAGTGGKILQTPHFILFVIYELYHSSGGTAYSTGYQIFDQPFASVTVGGSNTFIGTNTSDKFLVSIVGVPVYVATAGDYMKVRLSSTAPQATAGQFYEEIITNTLYPGTATFNTIYSAVTGEASQLMISYSTNLDNQYVRFKDFVPKSVLQIDYLSSIIKLFNLYPVQDPTRRNHFFIYTRDEYFSNTKTVDWTKKVDNLSDFRVKPIPELDASQLLFSYKPDKDWWNKQYNSLYGNYSYGSKRVETGYEFANSVKDVVAGTIFGPTPVIEYGANSYPGEGSIEIINGPVLTGGGAFPNSDASSNIVMASGYYAANGTLSPYQSQWPGLPVSNSFNGTKFTKAKVGVHIIYWGIEYIIDFVFNDYAFRVTDINGNDTVLRRPATVGSNQRISNTYYATNDGFTYVTNSTLVLPAIYDSSDNNKTHKPVKTEMKILHWQSLAGQLFPKTYSKYTVQYTPYVQNGMYFYQGTGTDSFATTRSIAPYASHLDNDVTPTKDLLFDHPIALFFNFTGTYPTKNLYTRYWINTVREITDKEAKFVDLMANISPLDVANLDLSELVFINGTNYRINEIRDYTPDSSLTAVELIRMPKALPTTPPPIVNAGPDQVVSGSTSTNFAGTATGGDDDGEVIVKTVWTLVSGPTGSTIANPGSLASLLTVPGLGSWTFQLYAIDNYGQSATDTVVITFANHGPCNPFVTAGNGGNITLPTSTNTLSGTTAGCNGSFITGTTWSQISGNTVTIINQNSLNASVSGITVAGTYCFRLTAQDNYGEIGYADTCFQVFPATTAIIANAIGSANIDSVTGFTGLTFDTGTNLPINGIGTFNGHHSALSSATIVVNTSGTIPVGTFHCTLKINGVVFDSQVASSGASYTFTGVTALSTDVVRIDLAT